MKVDAFFFQEQFAGSTSFDVVAFHLPPPLSVSASNNPPAMDKAALRLKSTLGSISSHARRAFILVWKHLA
jgi:hypothetical protein